jgi:hypothetical protein
MRTSRTISPAEQPPKGALVVTACTASRSEQPVVVTPASNSSAVVATRIAGAYS